MKRNKEIIKIYRVYKIIKKKMYNLHYWDVGLKKKQRSFYILFILV